jgi:hypothetical protein
MSSQYEHMASTIFFEKQPISPKSWKILTALPEVVRFDAPPQVAPRVQVLDARDLKRKPHYVTQRTSRRSDCF